MKISKPSKTLILKRTGAALLCVALGWYLKSRMTPNMGAAGMGQGTPYVLVEQVRQKDTTQANNHIAHVESMNSVDLLPQVSGTVDEVLFQEGSFVNKGDVLFVIDQDRYAAVLSQREAELASAKANLTEAQRNYNRQIKLTKESIASKATFDSAESAYLRAKAAVQQAEANLSLAKIDMDHTRITAPISGYIGKALVTQGNYVPASSQVLARIVQVNPIRVTFSLTDKEFLNLKQIYDVDRNAKFQARLTLPDGSIKTEDFKSRFADNEVNSSTATVSIFADFDNADEKLLPGNYIQIALIKDNPEQNVVIPQASLAQDEHGYYTYVVDDNNTAIERRLVLGAVIGAEQVVTSGLTAGEKVIVQGLQKVRNGMPVNAAVVRSDN